MEADNVYSWDSAALSCLSVMYFLLLWVAFHVCLSIRLLLDIRAVSGFGYHERSCCEHFRARLSVDTCFRFSRVSPSLGYLHFLRNCPIFFRNSCAILPFPPAVSTHSGYSTPWPTLVIVRLLTLAILTGVWGYRSVVVVCISLATGVEQFSMFLLATHLPAFSRFFSDFLLTKKRGCLSMVSCKGSF